MLTMVFGTCRLLFGYMSTMVLVHVDYDCWYMSTMVLVHVDYVFCYMSTMFGGSFLLVHKKHTKFVTLLPVVVLHIEDVDPFLFP